MKFTYCKVAGRRDMRLEPSRVPNMLRAMLRRATWEGVIVSPDAELGPDGQGQYPRLNLGWYPGFGYEVQCMELTGKDHFAVTSKTLSHPAVYVELGGQGQELWPRELFVPYEVAEKAVLYLLANEKRDPSVTWVANGAFKRRAVPERKREQVGRQRTGDA